VQADYFVYPMHPHNVSGKDRAHLMEKVLNYIIENND
jgi:dipeptidyl-peptidase-4